ncbi:DNA repair protein RecO [Paracoccus aerodenitrificans]|uniref:DNA repair protein RecO n=1 Tax=Paracoccus aerodenitrificans TaxID=3017781 RepID=UPI0022F05193|nr:DNA repair protein RecO [Paracoccus aerodenitrificans]WBU64499.1 DNA repair protein RecO [Paracoccus aerodenitrificans]
MEWRGEGTVIGRRPHGENAVVLDLLSLDAGRVSGLVPGGAGRSKSAMLQPGSRVSALWRARLEYQLGTFSVEPLQARPGILNSALALDGMNATAALLRFALPERDPHPSLVLASEALWDAMDSAEDWSEAYARWELMLLDEMGFGIDLSRCAVTGAQSGLSYVSPASGRAVTAEGAGEYAPRLLRLPQMFGGPPSNDDLVHALRLSGHFLHTRLAAAHISRPLPAARERLVARLTRR